MPRKANRRSRARRGRWLRSRADLAWRVVEGDEAGEPVGVAVDEVVDEDLILVRSLRWVEIDIAEVCGVLCSVEEVGATVDVDRVGCDRAAVQVVGDVGFECAFRTLLSHDESADEGDDDGSEGDECLLHECGAQTTVWRSSPWQVSCLRTAPRGWPSSRL